MPQIKQWMRDAAARIFKEVSGSEGMIEIIASEYEKAHAPATPARPLTPPWQEKIDRIRKTVDIARKAYPHSDKWLNMYADDVEDMLKLIDSMIWSVAEAAPTMPQEGEHEAGSHRGVDSSMDDNRASQQSDHAGTSVAHLQSGGIFAKDAAKWLRERWPHRPMTTGGLPDESLEPHFQPTRKDIERWLVEYAKDAMPLSLPSPPAGQGRKP